MKKNVSTNIVIIIASVAIIIVTVCVFVINKAIPNTTIVSNDIDYDIKKTKSEIFYDECFVGENLFYVPDEDYYDRYYEDDEYGLYDTSTYDW